MNRILSARFRSASMIPLMPSPGNPNTTSTPQSEIVSMRISAAVVFIGHSTGQRYPAQCIKQHYDYQYQTHDTDASAASPSRISVIATASAEQEKYKNDQQ